MDIKPEQENRGPILDQINEDENTTNKNLDNFYSKYFLSTVEGEPIRTTLESLKGLSAQGISTQSLLQYLYSRDKVLLREAVHNFSGHALIPFRREVLNNL